MGIVNDYINKLLSYVKKDKKENKEKPWLKYYGDMPEDIEDIMKGIELYNKQHYFGCHGGN